MVDLSQSALIISALYSDERGVFFQYFNDLNAKETA